LVQAATASSSWFGGASSAAGRGGVDEAGEAFFLPEHKQRRLEELIASRLTVHETDPAALDEAGQLPKLRHGGLVLKEVFVVHREEPSKIRRAKIPDGYKMQHDKGRRLNAFLDVVNHSLSLEFVRDRVRAMAILNAAAHPAQVYESAANITLLTQASLVYEQDLQIFQSAIPDLQSDPVWAAAVESMNSTVSASALRSDDNITQERWALRFGSSYVREKSGSKWKQDLFMGSRGKECQGFTTDQGGCLTDMGVSISVYEELEERTARVARRVILFHGGAGQSDIDYTMFLHRLWVLERAEDELMLTWNLDAGMSTTMNMTNRRAETAFERPVRCAFKDFAYSPVPEVDKIAEELQISSKRIQEQGLWVLVKEILRIVLPEDRNKADEPQTFFTGSGTGGMHASVASMWLKKVDEVTYETYMIAGVGYECAARRLWDKDVRTFDPHEQLHSYSHVMDIYANSLDQKIGEDCLFGKKSFETNSPARFFCERPVGHSGPELFYRGPPVQVKIAGVTEEMWSPTEDMLAAQRAMDACSYFAHSPWYAAMLLLEDNVLHFDGKTDGGCTTRPPIEQQDRLEMCPLKTWADVECLLLLDNVQPLPVTAMIITASSLGGCICAIGLCGYICLRRVRDDKHLYEDQGDRMPFPCCCIKRRKDGTERERQARQRVKDKRAKVLQKEMKKQGIGTDMYEAKTAKKKVKKEGEEEDETAPFKATATKEALMNADAVTTTPTSSGTGSDAKNGKEKSEKKKDKEKHTAEKTKSDHKHDEKEKDKKDGDAGKAKKHSSENDAEQPKKRLSELPAPAEASEGLGAPQVEVALLDAAA